VRKPRPLRTEPQSASVHWLVDSAIVFLILILPSLFFSVRWPLVALIALAIGAVATPYSRRAEVRGLAARHVEDHDDPA
jgi:hypothetical protein